jgi:hypothetical protein
MSDDLCRKTLRGIELLSSGVTNKSHVDLHEHASKSSLGDPTVLRCVVLDRLV